MLSRGHGKPRLLEPKRDSGAVAPGMDIPLAGHAEVSNVAIDRPAIRNKQAYAAAERHREVGGRSTDGLGDRWKDEYRAAKSRLRNGPVRDCVPQLVSHVPH